MRRQDLDGWSYALVAALFWIGSGSRFTAMDVAGRKAVVAESAGTDEAELYAEMNADIHRGFDNRLAFEVWADAR